MDGVLSFLLDLSIALIIFYVFFHMMKKIVEGKDDAVDMVIEWFRLLILKFKKSYGNIRQRFCKESNKVDADRGTVQDYGEVYDSSSVWED